MDGPGAPVCASAPARLVTETDVVALLRRGVDEAGSQRVYAARHRLSPTDLCQVLGGRKAASRSLLRAVGVRRALVLDGGAA